MAFALGFPPLRVAVLGLAIQLCFATQPLSDLLQRESQDEQTRRASFEDWCKGQLTSETRQRDAMQHLHDQVVPLVNNGTHLSGLSHQVSHLAQQLESRETAAASAATAKSRAGIDLEDAKRDVQTLTKVQGKLARKFRGASFLQSGKGKSNPVGALAALLRAAQAKERGAADKLSEPTRLQKEAEELRAEYEAKSAALAQLQTRQLAAVTSRDLLFSAVEDEDAFVADLEDICTLGKDVFKRYEQEVQPALQSVAHKIARLSAAPTMKPAPATTSAPTTPPPPATTTTHPPTTTTAAPTTTPPPPTTTQPPPPTTTTPAPTTTEAAEEDTPPPTTAAKVHHHKHKTTTTTTTEAPTTTLWRAPTTPPPPVDLDDDDAPPTPAPKKHHGHKSATTTVPPAAPDMDDAFTDDDAAAPPAKHKKASLLATKATPAPADAMLDPDDDMPPPAPTHAKKSSHPANDPMDDDDDDMSAAAPPLVKKAAKKAAPTAPAPNKKDQFLQDMYASAAGRMPSAYSAWSPGGDDVTTVAKKSSVSAVDAFKKQLDDDDDDDAPPPPKHKHHSKAHVDADYDTDTPSPPPNHDLDGGLDAALQKAPKGGAKKHKFADDTTNIMSIIQQPKDYSAWSPTSPTQDKSSVNQDSNAQLKAAEAAFDSDDFLQLSSDTHSGGVASIIRAALDDEDEEDAPPAMMFLERSSSHVEAMGVDASSLILEQFGSALESTPLLELARARLSMPKLKSLWRKVQTVDASSAQDKHARTEAQWCRDFQRKTLASADARREAHDGAKAELLSVEAQLAVTKQDAAAMSQVSVAFAAGTKQVQSMQARMQHQFDSTAALLARMAAEVSALGPVPEAGAVLLDLGRLQGTVTSGSAEIGDVIRSAVARRGEAEKTRKASAMQLGARSGNLEEKMAVLSKAATAQDDATSVTGQGSDDRYKQMCKWVLDDAETKERKQAAEKSAIHDALLVLKPH